MRQPKTRKPKAKFAPRCFLCKEPLRRRLVLGKMVEDACDCTADNRPPEPVPYRNGSRNLDLYDEADDGPDVDGPYGPPRENVIRAELGYRGIDPIDLEW
jgi:hypothetical protein